MNCLKGRAQWLRGEECVAMNEREGERGREGERERDSERREREGKTVYVRVCESVCVSEKRNKVITALGNY